MSSHTATALPGSPCFDNCLITSCLKKLFTRSAKSASLPDFKINNHIAAFKKELLQLNSENVVELSFPYLQGMEQSMPGAGFFYVVFYHESVPVLFCYFQLCILTSENFRLDKKSTFVKGIFRFFLDLKKVKVLMLGNALRSETASYCFNGTALTSNQAIEIITAIAEKIANEENTTAIILKDLHVSAHKQKWLSGLGFQVPWEDKTMVMNIDKQWENLDDYVAALGRKYKTRAKKILASRSALSARLLTEQEINAAAGEIYRLFKNVAENQPFKLIQPLEDHFSLMKKVYGDNFEVYGFYYNNKLVAFYSAFVTDAAYELYYIGVDYEHNKEHHLYFNILFSGLEQAILKGKRQLQLGRTSFDAKASLGAKPVELSYFIKIPNIPNVVISWFANYFSSIEDTKWKLRVPLK